MNEQGSPSESNCTVLPLLLLAALAALFLGCSTTNYSDESIPQTEVRVDFSDPVLARRQIHLFGNIDQQAAERAIQRLLYLEGVGHEPIALYLNTPGGEMQHAMAIEQTTRLLQSKVNTYAIGECNSGGAFLLAAGTGKRRAFRGAIIVVHGLTVQGRPPAEFTKMTQESYTEFWRKRSRLADMRSIVNRIAIVGDQIKDDLHQRRKLWEQARTDFETERQKLELARKELDSRESGRDWLLSGGLVFAVLLLGIAVGILLQK